jgi:hypothetical protein
MNYSLIVLAALSLIGLSACEKPTIVNAPADTIVVPVPGPTGEKGPPGASGDDGIQRVPGKGGDAGIQGEQGEPSGDTQIEIVPPNVALPPDISTTPTETNPAK